MEIIKIGDYNVQKDDVWLYIYHFGKDKSNIWEWEKLRKIFHDNIFHSINLDRYSEAGKEFSLILDKFCEPHILKYDALEVKARKYLKADNKEKEKLAKLELDIEIAKSKMKTKLGFRNFKANDKNICRICNKELKGGRINDHLADVIGFEEINQPICMDCSKNNPDEYHIAFKKQYWNK